MRYLIFILFILASCGSDDSEKKAVDPGTLEVLSANYDIDAYSKRITAEAIFDTSLRDGNLYYYGWILLGEISKDDFPEKCDWSTASVSPVLDYVYFEDLEYDTPYYIRLCAGNKESKYISEGITKEITIKNPEPDIDIDF